MKRGIHHGNPDCERYLKMYHAISKGRKTTAELQEATSDMATHSTICEMRKAGYPISPARYMGKINNRRVYSYEIERPA